MKGFVGFILTLLTVMGASMVGAAHSDDIERRWLISRREAARRLGIGLTTLQEEIAAGRIASCKVGRRRLIPYPGALDAYCELLRAEAADTSRA